MVQLADCICVKKIIVCGKGGELAIRRLPSRANRHEKTPDPFSVPGSIAVSDAMSGEGVRKAKNGRPATRRKMVPDLFLTGETCVQMLQYVSQEFS